MIRLLGFSGLVKSKYFSSSRITLLILFLWFNPQVKAQTSMDSLLQRLSQPGLSQKDQVLLSTAIGKEYAESRPELGLKYIEEAENILKKSPNDTLLLSLLIAKSINYSYLARYDISTKISMEALKMSQKLNDKTAMLDAHNNLGIDFMYTEDYSNAQKYLNEFVRLSEIARDSLRWGHGLNNLGLISYYLGNAEEELNYYVKAKEIFERINEKEGLGNTLLNIGTVYTATGNHQKAQEYFADALIIFEEIKYISAYSNVLQSMAEDYLKQGKYKKAETLASEALALVRQNDLKQDVVYASDLLQNIYQKQGKYKEAYELVVSYHEVKDSIFNEKITQQLAELQTKYETEKKESEIQQLKLENNLKEVSLANARNQIIGLFIIGFMLLALIAVYFTQRNKKLQAEKLQQEFQLDALRKRIIEIQSGDAVYEDVEIDSINEKINSPLTDRELEALKLIMQGKANREIAEALFVSINTVKFHLSNIYQKLGVANKREALEYVVKSS
ncbi:MAG: tetratricopeptide repeat protein [Fulvivirga sp.]|uniref:tetratricopeptide repeat protein n=1 Tax=Fulvivirga sp. TaxID=1931237 RepID=UPI0032EBF746